MSSEDKDVCRGTSSTQSAHTILSFECKENKIKASELKVSSADNAADAGALVLDKHRGKIKRGSHILQGDHQIWISIPMIELAAAGAQSIQPESVCVCVCLCVPDCPSQHKHTHTMATVLFILCSSNSSSKCVIANSAKEESCLHKHRAKMTAPLHCPDKGTG